MSENKELACLTIQDEQIIQKYITNGFKKTEAFACVLKEENIAKARYRANKFFSRTEVQERIAAAYESVCEHTHLASLRTLQELQDLAFVNIKDFYDDKDNLIPLSKLSRSSTAAILAVDEHYDNEGNLIKKSYKLHDKIKSLTKMMEHLKLINNHSTEINLNQTNTQVNITAEMTDKEATDLYEQTIKRC